MESWYALQVRSNTENRVDRNLRDRGFEAFYPHYVEKSRDRRRDVEKKFFPGYVFCLSNLSLRNPAIGIPQVVRIIGCGDNHPLAIPESEIEAVRVLAASPLVNLAAPCPFLNRGEKVQILYGPMVGQVGYVVRDKHKARIVLSIGAIGQSWSVEVDRDAIERVPERKAA